MHFLQACCFQVRYPFGCYFDSIVFYGPCYRYFTVKNSGILGSETRFLFFQDLVREWQSKNMNAPTIPEVRWEDVGGLEHIITELLDTIQLPLKFPELIQSGLKRSGLK